jgi:NhaA family Na+:H+ antiporter
MKHDDPTSDHVELPAGPIKAFMAPLTRFMHIEAAAGLVLLACTILALVVANSPWGDAYLAFWKTPVGLVWGDYAFVHSLKHWINDGLMAIFFFVIGLEVKREMVLGELRDPRQAMLPLFAALGGMIVPAGLYLAFLYGQPGEAGWGIPMATDIAFVVGCLAILGSRVPHSLRVFLLSLAIVDDIGAILVIAVGYSSSISVFWLILAAVGLGVTIAGNVLGIRAFLFYVLVGIFVWFAFHESGVHATLAGVLLGLLTPAKSYVARTMFNQLLDRVSQVIHGDWEGDLHRLDTVDRLRWAAREVVSPLEFLEHHLHPVVGFLIMPIFALANAGVVIDARDMVSPIALAVGMGLVLGKPIGVFTFTWAIVQTGFTKRPAGVSWLMILGGGCLAGIGFTMAMFIAALAFDDGNPLLAPAKLGILAASFLSAVLGFVILYASGKPLAIDPTLDDHPLDSEEDRGRKPVQS